MLDFTFNIINPDVGPQLKQIQERLIIMPTQSDLDAKLAELETALTTEIQEITDALAADGVSQASLDKLDALKERISGIINPVPPVV
jgi:hypothetical protein